MTSRWAAFVPAAMVAVADRATKVWVEANISAWDTWEIVPGFFQVIHTQNRGMAFSLFADGDSEARRFLLIALSLVVMGFITVLLWRMGRSPGERWQRLSLSLVLGGAFGNMYDRVAKGSVTDFLDLFIGDYHWPTFNVADSAITVGAALLALELWRGRSLPGGR